MKLTNPTDDQLDAAFAEHVAGYFPPTSKEVLAITEEGGWAEPEEVWLANGYITRWSYLKDRCNFTRSADAVLPWMDRSEMWCDEAYCGEHGWHIEIATPEGKFEADGPFPKASVIALLRAHGVEVEFNK